MKRIWLVGTSDGREWKATINPAGSFTEFIDATDPRTGPARTYRINISHVVWWREIEEEEE